ncbi:hypothetical protein [Streptomyces sp. NPDC001500]
MAYITIGRVNIRSVPSDDYKLHPYAKRKRDPLTHRSAFLSMLSVFGRQSGVEVFRGGEESDEVFREIQIVMSGSHEFSEAGRFPYRKVVVHGPLNDTFIAVDAQDRWVAMEVPGKKGPETVAAETQSALRELAEIAQIPKELEVYVDLIASPAKVYESLTSLRESGITRLELTVKRRNPAGIDLDPFVQNWIENHKAHSAKVEVVNEEGELDFSASEVRGIARGARDGSLTVSASSADGRTYDSASDPVYIHLPDNVSRRGLVLFGIFMFPARRRKGGQHK